jgi:hypothetical protein
MSENTVVMIDPEFTKLALDELIADAGVSLLFHSYLTRAHTDAQRVTEIAVADHGGSVESGARRSSTPAVTATWRASPEHPSALRPPTGARPRR